MMLKVVGQAIFQYRLELLMGRKNRRLIDKNLHQDFDYDEMELIKMEMEMNNYADEDMNQSIDTDNIEWIQMYCRIRYHDQILLKNILIHSNLCQSRLRWSNQNSKIETRRNFTN